MRIAICGKGGSGKTTVAGALARQFARRGLKVVAIDADPNPNLGVCLGLPRDSVETMEPILNALLASGHTHNDPKPEAEDLLARYGVEAPDGVIIVATGKIERPSNACLCCGSHNTTRQFFSELSDEGRVVVADLEAGLNDLLWAHPGPEDVVVAISESSAKAVEVARRACRVAESMGVKRILGVANRATSEQEVADLAEALGVEVLSVAEDPDVEKADELGVAPLDRDETSPAMADIARLADRLLAV